MKDGKYTIPDIHPPSDPEVHPWTNNASKELQKQVLFFFATDCFLKCNTGNAFVTELLTIDKRFHPPIDFHVDLWVNLEGYRFYKMKTKQIGPKLLVVFFCPKKLVTLVYLIYPNAWNSFQREMKHHQYQGSFGFEFASHKSHIWWQ